MTMNDSLHILTVILSSLSVLSSCSGPERSDKTAAAEGGRDEAAPSAVAATDSPFVKEGRIEAAARCPILHTPDGERFSLALENPAYLVGAYVNVVGKASSDASCGSQYQAITVDRIEPVSPPARDRDPARSGGLAVSSDYVRGTWVMKGPDADCRQPDFTIRPNKNGMGIIRTRLNGKAAMGAVDVGATPALHFDEPMPSLHIETRGPDGLAILPPANGEVVSLAGHPIIGDGEVFVRCSSG